MYLFGATSQIMLQLPMGREGAFRRQSAGCSARAEVESGSLNPQSNMLVFFFSPFPDPVHSGFPFPPFDEVGLLLLEVHIFTQKFPQIFTTH